MKLFTGVPPGHGRASHGRTSARRSRLVGCGLISVAALLGPAPVATAGELADADPAAPQAGVSMLALSLTAGGAVAAVGSGVALALTRRRKAVNALVSPASRSSG